MKAALFCGQSSFPRQDSATANRYRAIAEITADLGYHIVFVNRHPSGIVADDALLHAPFGIIDVSGNMRKTNWVWRQLVRLVAQPREFCRIAIYGMQHQVEVVHVYTQFASDLIFYKMLSKLIGAKCVLHVVEYRSKIRNRHGILRLNDIVYDKLAARFFLRYVSISNLITSKILGLRPTAQVALVPPVCDFAMIDQMEKAQSERPYFLYCASMAYEDVAMFVIKAFLQMPSEDCDLVLVLSGTPSAQVLEACAGTKSITLLSQLPYGDLIARYKGAIALLIPLRDNLQDASRYPQKMSEYIASRRPIITCAVGDVARHFEHLKTALVATRYDVTEFASLLAFAILNRSQLEEIAQAGYERGREIFDLKSQVSRIKAIVQ